MTQTPWSSSWQSKETQNRSWKSFANSSFQSFFWTATSRAECFRSRFLRIESNSSWHPCKTFKLFTRPSQLATQCLLIKKITEVSSLNAYNHYILQSNNRMKKTRSKRPILCFVSSWTCRFLISQHLASKTSNHQWNHTQSSQMRSQPLHSRASTSCPQVWWSSISPVFSKETNWLKRQHKNSKYQTPPPPALSRTWAPSATEISSERSRGTTAKQIKDARQKSPKTWLHPIFSRQEWAHRNQRFWNKVSC